MKIRNGFVSNSSSSSFCIYGAQITERQLKNIIKKIDIENTDGYKEYTEYTKTPSVKDYIKQSTSSDLLGSIGEFLDLFTFYQAYDSDVYMYLGRSYTTLDDDETGSDFKKSVEDKLKPFEIKDFDVFEEMFEG